MPDGAYPRALIRICHTATVPVGGLRGSTAVVFGGGAELKEEHLKELQEQDALHISSHLLTRLNTFQQHVQEFNQYTVRYSEHTVDARPFLESREQQKPFLWEGLCRDFKD